MHYISIGITCNVKYQINKHKGTCETLFFDWLGTDISSVILVLNCNNIEEILNINTIVIDNKINHINKPHSRVVIKSLPYCVSIHDIPIQINDDSISGFIDKYKRRFHRLIEYIKSNEKICFIRFSKMSVNDKKLFIEAILRINPNCDFCIVNINMNETDDSIYKENRILNINLMYSPSEVEKLDWTRSYLDWKKIFADIENNI